MKKRIVLFIAFVAVIAAAVTINGCAASKKLTSKIGAQLWSENCLRCHNAPDPADYSDEQWEVIGVHMKLRANSLTDDELSKVVEFMKSAN